MPYHGVGGYSPYENPMKRAISGLMQGLIQGVEARQEKRRYDEEQARRERAEKSAEEWRAKQFGLDERKFEQDKLYAAERRNEAAERRKEAEREATRQMVQDAYSRRADQATLVRNAGEKYVGGAARALPVTLGLLDGSTVLGPKDQPRQPFPVPRLAGGGVRLTPEVRALGSLFEGLQTNEDARESRELALLDRRNRAAVATAWLKSRPGLKDVAQFLALEGTPEQALDMLGRLGVQLPDQDLRSLMQILETGQVPRAQEPPMGARLDAVKRVLEGDLGSYGGGRPGVPDWMRQPLPGAKARFDAQRERAADLGATRPDRINLLRARTRYYEGRTELNRLEAANRHWEQPNFNRRMDLAERKQAWAERHEAALEAIAWERNRLKGSVLDDTAKLELMAMLDEVKADLGMQQVLMRAGYDAEYNDQDVTRANNFYRAAEAAAKRSKAAREDAFKLAREFRGSPGATAGGRPAATAPDRRRGGGGVPVLPPGLPGLEKPPTRQEVIQRLRNKKNPATGKPYTQQEAEAATKGLGLK